MKNSYPNLTIISPSNALLKAFKKNLFFVFAFFALTIQSFGQGTTCANATTVSINGACRSNDNPNGNDSAPFYNNNCGNGSGNNQNDIGWYQFTVSGGPLSVTVTAIGNRNLAFQLIGSTTNNCSNLSEIACVNAQGGSNNNDSTETTTQLLSNGTYFIKVLSSGGNNMTLTSLCVTATTPEYIVPATGNNTIATCSGNLYDNGSSTGNYANNSNGYTVINPSVPGNKVSLNGTLNIEPGWDSMTIYDGVGTGGTILFSSSNINGSCTSYPITNITSTTGPLTVRFTSDGSVTCSGFNLAISCIATPVPTITTLSSASGCVGSSLTITGTNLASASSVTIGGTAATITANSATSITVTVGTGATGNVIVTTAGGTSNASSFTVLATPTITVQPAAPASVCAGSGTRTISVTATNATTYQWRRNGVALTNTPPYSGVNTATLTITNPVIGIAGNFDVIVTNASTCNRTSNAVAVTVLTTPTITTNPANSSIAAGANTSFSVVASNSPSNYTWEVSTNGGSTWTTVTNGGVYTNATTATLNITNASGTMDGYRYRAFASNSCGTSAFSNAAILTVNLAYCIPTTQTTNRVYIDRIDFVGTLNDVSNTSTFSSNGYQNFTGLTNNAIQAQGEGVNIILNNVNVNNTNTGGRVKAWIDWNKDGVFSQNAAEEIYNPGPYAGANLTFGFIIPPATPPGMYRIRFRVYNNSSNGFGYNFSPCESFTGSNFSDVEDYLFEVIPSCSANIISVSDGINCGSGPVTISATGTSDTTSYRWYTSETSTTPIAGATGSSYTTPTISTTTTYYVTAFNGTCESVVKTPVVANITPTPTINITPENPVICGENAVISIVAGGDKETVTLAYEDFESNTLGAFNNVNNDSNNSTDDAKTAWQIKSSSFIPSTGIVWYPAISSGIGNNKFALATSDINPIAGNTIENSLTLASSVNTNDFLNLSLKLKMFYSRELTDNDTSFDEYVKIQVSTNNGSTWTDVETILTDVGIGTRFANLEYDLDAYINNSNVSVRILHRAFSSSGMWLAGGVAVDNIKLYGEKTLSTSFNYDTSVVDAFMDIACTIPYASGSPATTIFIRPTVTQLENATFIIPVSTTLSNGCIVSGNVNVTNNTKLYTPDALDTDWNTSTNWRPVGVPTESNCIIVYEDVTITGPNNIEKGLNLIVKSGKKLNIASGNSLIITDFVNVEPNGTFQIENNSNLVQINNVTNTGNIIYKRIAPSIKGSDYVYWSSPVNNQAISSFYTSPAQGPKYSWNTLANNGNGASGNISQGNWENPPASMANGSGYIIRGSSSFGMAATNISSTFTGRPNNGTISVPIYRGDYTGGGYAGANGVPINNLDDNYNLIGNPYPSAINALQFISENPSIEKNVKLWKHGIDAVNGATNPFYGSFAYNYSGSDYITINFTGSTTPTSSDIIKSGQAFFVEMLDGATGSGTVNFNNTIRRDGSGLPYLNDDFFRNSNQQTTSFENAERHRIWLDIVDANNIAETTLLGYVSGATVAKESAYDAIASTLTMGIYSLINDETFVIQGRNLPFDDNDQVAIGFNVPTAGTYHIAINTIDGLFLGTQDIYLKDELLNIYHDLKSAPYLFTTAAGIHDTRFKLVYKNTVLSNVTFNENEIQITKNKNIVDIISGNETMKNVKIFDIRGRLIVEKTNINSNSISIDMNNIQDQVLIINIVTSEGIKVTRKIL